MAAAKCDPCTSSLSSPSFENFALNYKMLKPLDDALRCSICFEYYTNCMMTKCSHNYCSICIRKYMTYRSQCPTCFQDASEPELRNNRLIDEILRLYKKLRSLDEETPPFSPIISDSPHTVFLQDISSNSQSTSSMSSQSSTSNESFTPRVKIEIPDEDETPYNRLKERIKREPDFNEVTCPVCYNIVLADRINPHLDSCLKQQFTDDYDRKKTLPKLVYHLLSDKEIKVKLKEQGLSTSGSRQALIRRHKSFVTLYNANCDALKPKPVEDLVAEIELQEIEEKVNYLPKQIQVHKRSDQALIDHQHQAYIRNHQHQFNALINDVHRRQINNMKSKPKKDPFIKSFAYSPKKELSDLENTFNEDNPEKNISEIKIKEEQNNDSDSSSSSNDTDLEKMHTNVAHKRKKATISIKNQESPKKSNQA